MLKGKITRLSLAITLTIVGLMWAVFVLDYNLGLDLYKYGLKPRTTEGLIGILTAPFIHSTQDFAHIINNSVPTLILGWMLFYHYRTVAGKTFVFIYFSTGLLTWLLARDSYHVGMSGVIYGLTSFLVTSGFLRKNMRVAAISLVVIFLYGSTVWGIFPNQPNISWEGHAFGMLSGVLMALLMRKKGPQPSKLRYEIEEELGIEPEFEYWKSEPETQPQQQPPIILNYAIVPEQVKVEGAPKQKEDPENNNPS